MTEIVQAGSVNVASLVVPDALVQIVPPSNRPITGAPTNILGLVGTATWGPTDIATVVGGNDEQLANFGPVQNRTYDLGTAVAVAVQQGANNFKCVRRTDGTDTAATGSYSISQAPETATIGGTLTVGDTLKITMTPSTGTAISFQYTTRAADTTALMAAGLLAAAQASAAATAAGFAFSVSGSALSIYAPSGGVTWTYGETVSPGNTETITLATGSAGNVAQLTLTGKYTGSRGNSITATLSPGTAAASMKLVIALPNGQPEVFDNITGAGNLLWANLANAVNNGQSGLRGPSQIAVASAGSGTAAAPSSSTSVAMSGGTDGATTITTTTLVGVDAAPRKGMYALRNQGCSVVNLADAQDSTQWTAMLAFGLAEGCFVGTSGVPGDTITNAATELSTAGVDGYGLKVFFGDWVYWYDQVNGVQRLLAPATFWAGMRAALTPQNSTLNKPLAGIIGTQKSYTGGVYSDADLQALLSARLDVICNPAPGGSYFAVRGGINTSSNPAINGENYTMMTNFLAKSIANWAGSVVGQLQTATQRRQAKASGDNFFANLWALGMIGNADGTVPWQVAINDTTTPANLAALGYEIAAIKVQYLSVIKYFVVNMEGGQTVTIQLSPAAPAFMQAA